jgi:hypothetical protein
MRAAVVVALSHGSDPAAMPAALSGHLSAGAHRFPAGRLHGVGSTVVHPTFQFGEAVASREA